MTGRDLPSGPFSTPRFLAAQRSAVSSRREEIAVVALAAQHNTRVCGPLCDPRGARSILPHRSSIFYGFCQHSLSGLQLQSGMQYVQRSGCRAANLQSFAAARHFCSAKILAGGLPAQRNFQRKFALRQVGSSKSVVPPTIERLKVRNNAQLGKSLYRAAPGCQRDRGPSVSGGVQRNPFQGVPLGNFFLTVDAVLLCAAKKNGVETYQAGRVLPVKTGTCRHGRQQKLTVPPSQRQTPPAGGNSPAKPPARSCLPAHTAPCRASSPDILPGRDENHS